MSTAHNTTDTATTAPVAARGTGIAPYPVWISPKWGLATAYYRALIPARITGGQCLDRLTIRRTGAVVTEEIDVATALHTLAGPTGAAVSGLGAPTIFCWPAVDRAGLPVVLGRLRTGGVDAWLDTDNDSTAYADDPDWWVAQRMQADDSERDRQVFRMRARAWAPGVRADFVHCLRAAVAVVVSTPTLAEVVRPYARAVQVLPNLLDPADVPLAPRTGTGLAIGYAGCWEHRDDLRLLALPALLACARLPEVTLHFWGIHPRQLEETEARAWQPGAFSIEGVRYQFHGLIRTFADYLASSSVLDLAVAPLLDTPFNRARAQTKWVEHSMHQTAMVVSDLPPYACVEHGVTGFKAKTSEEFAVYLRRLVEDADLRKR